MTQRQVWDVIVVGGGAAGLSCALTLVRARRRVLVLDTAEPRNRFTEHMHGVLGRDGTSPADLLADGRDEIIRYGGVLRSEGVIEVIRARDGFEIVTDHDRHCTRRVVVASGARDVLPDVDGLAELWGRGVAVCPYCDGYEVRDQPIGILATGPNSVHQAQLLRQWSDNIIYLAGSVGTPEGTDRDAFDARSIRIVESPVEEVLSVAGRVQGVRLVSGERIELAAIFTMPTLVPRDEFLDGLRPETTDTPMGRFLTVDSTGHTSIRGIWAAGNVTNPAANVPMSAGAGAAVAGMVNYDLVVDDTERALAHRKGRA